MGNSDNVIGYIEYLSDDGKIVGYVTPFTDVDKFRKEILKATEVGMPITPVVFPDKLDKSLGLPRDIYWPGGFRKEKRQMLPCPKTSKTFWPYAAAAISAVTLFCRTLPN